LYAATLDKEHTFPGGPAENGVGRSNEGKSDAGPRLRDVAAVFLALPCAL